MKINIISIYFPPEGGAAANRIFNMAKELQLRGAEIQIITALPNYPYGKIFEGYKGLIFDEVIENIKVRRHWVYASNSKNPILRVFSMMSFSLSILTSFFYLRKFKADLIIVNSPPLLSGYFGVLLGKIISKKVVTNISDIWPLSALELGAIKKGRFYFMLEKMEKKMYLNSDLLISQSVETQKHINNIAPFKKVVLYRNIPKNKDRVLKFNHNKKFKIIYAGLLGVAQGINYIIQSVDFVSLGVELHIYGDGNEKQVILEYLKRNPESNIFFHGMKKSTEIEELMPLFDASLIPLRTNIYGAFPSKIFSAISSGLPVLFSGHGEGKEFVIENNIGLTNEPNEIKDLIKNIEKLKSLNENEYLKYRNDILIKSKELSNFRVNNDNLYSEIKNVLNE